MKAGRVIDGDEHDAQMLADKIVRDAPRRGGPHHDGGAGGGRQARRRREVAREQLVTDARPEASGLPRARHAEAARLRDDAKVHANQLVEGGAAETSPSIAVPPDRRRRQVDEVVGLVIRATVPGVALGEVVQHRSPRCGEPLRRRGRRVSRRAGGAAAARRARRRRAGERGVADRRAARRSRAATSCSGACSTASAHRSTAAPPLAGEALGRRSRRHRRALARPPITRAAADRRARDRRDADARRAVSASGCSRRRASASRRCSARSRAARAPT